MIKFHTALSQRSVYLRYFHLVALDVRVSHERLAKVCCIDYDHDVALVAERNNEIVAIGRLAKADNGNEAEFALLISDPFQGHGLGTELLHRLIEIARADKLQKITAEILPENDQMLRVCRQAGFKLRLSPDEHVVKADLAL
jgi:acetyltransferase